MINTAFSYFSQGSWYFLSCFLASFQSIIEARCLCVDGVLCYVCFKAIKGRKLRLQVSLSNGFVLLSKSKLKATKN